MKKNTTFVDDHLRWCFDLILKFRDFRSNQAVHSRQMTDWEKKEKSYSDYEHKESDIVWMMCLSHLFTRISLLLFRGMMEISELSEMSALHIKCWCVSSSIDESAMRHVRSENIWFSFFHFSKTNYSRHQFIFESRLLLKSSSLANSKIRRTRIMNK